MMYKTLSLVAMFVLFFGVNQIKAQEIIDPCDYITEIGIAVDAVVAAESDGWVTPFALTNFVDKLEYLCDGGIYGGMGYTTVEVIVDKMILVAQRAIDSTCVPAPPEAVEALEALIVVLKNTYTT